MALRIMMVLRDKLVFESGCLLLLEGLQEGNHVANESMTCRVWTSLLWLELTFSHVLWFSDSGGPFIWISNVHNYAFCNKDIEVKSSIDTYSDILIHDAVQELLCNKDVLYILMCLFPFSLSCLSSVCDFLHFPLLTASRVRALTSCIQLWVTCTLGSVGGKSLVIF